MNVFRLHKVIGVLEVLTLLKELPENENVVFILNEKESIYHFIEKLDINRVNLSRLKIVNEINFSTKAFLKDKYSNQIISEIKSLSEALENMNANEIYKYILILASADNDKCLISDIIQQFIYLDLDIDVMLEKEEKERDSVETFRQHFNRLKLSVANSHNSIFHMNVTNQLQGPKEKILKLIDEIELVLFDTEKKELSITVMATKKSGKSVIVNSFLGNDYAPTSLELPTLNSIVYKNNSDNDIVLDYKNESKVFESVDHIRNYLEEMYKNAQLGYCTEDMYIHYKVEKESFNNFTIIDTPGPNLAGSNHREIAYKWIESTDVIIFVVDYSKYLTTDEEKFLSDIKTAFEKHDKFYSFIVIVNKIDLMYTSGEKGSVIRFLDFLRFKLKELGYRGFAIFAISALQYFSAVKVPKLEGCEHLYEETGEQLMAELRTCKSKYLGKRELSLIRTLENYIRDLEDYHGITDANLNMVKEKSGMPRLMNYTDYVTYQKTTVESLKTIMRKIDDEFVNLKNEFLTFDLINLIDTKGVKEKKKEELLNNIKDLFEMFDKSNLLIEEELDFTKLKEEINEDLKNSEDELLKIIYEEMEKEIQNIKDSFRHKSNEELRDIVNGDTNIITPEFQTNFYNTISDKFDQKIANYECKINNELDIKQKQLVTIDKEIQQSIKLFNKQLNNSFEVDSINITLPKLELAFSKKNFDFSKVDIKALTEIQNIIKKSLYQKHGVIGRLMQIITLNHTDKRFGKYELDYDSIDEMVAALLQELRNEVINAIKENTTKILIYLNSYLTEELQPKIKEEINSMIDNYKDLIIEIKASIQISEDDLENDIKFIQEKINFFEHVNSHLQIFFEIWENVRFHASSSANGMDNGFKIF
ncbi:MAG: dynamin family protein [Clostridiaceae bacterium]|nr:dynamin family protein [Clostridiaceae bacterium]